MEQFDLRPDPKTQAIIGLVMTAGMIYGPRAYLIQYRRSQEKAERRADESGNGTAGMYGPNGEPLGTTEFTVPPPTAQH